MTNMLPERKKENGSILRHLVVLMMLGVGCYFGVKAFYHQIDAKVVQRPAADEIEQIAQAAPAMPAEPMELADREAITRRNIFLPKNPAGQGDYSAELMEGLEASQADLVLMGTIVENGGDNRAVILDVESKQQHMLKEGEEIGGVSIQRISSGKVVISRQGRNELLDIAEARNLQASAAAPSNPTGRLDVSSYTAAEENSDALPNDGDAIQTDADSGLKIDMNRLEDKRPGIAIKGRISE